MPNVNTKRKWDRLAKTWVETGPPASPSADDISHYQSLMRSGMAHLTPRSRLLILGSTPGLRRLGATMGVNVTCSDISLSMYRQTTKHLGNLQKQESFLEADWCSLDKLALTFDAIIGDKVFDNIPPALWVNFKKAMCARVKLGGVFITRVAPQNKSLPGRSFASLLKYWAKQFESSAVDLQRAASGLWEQALGASAIPGCGPSIQCVSYFANEIEELKTSRTLSKSAKRVFKEYLSLFGSTSNDSWTSYSLGMLIDFLSDEFRLESIRYSSDYTVSPRQPLLMFRR